MQFAQMYEHYERHRTDNITDPAVRRSQPISTISGWDRDRDDSIENKISSIGQQPPATTNSTSQTNGSVEVNGDESQPKIRKISKSEGASEISSADLENVKCACEEEELSSNTTASVQTDDVVIPAISTIETGKSVSSISNISQVYNEQISGNVVLCNGNGNGHVSTSEDESAASPHKEPVVAGNEALRQVLEIDTYEKEEESKEIVQELVEEILQKSESLLDDCQKTLEREKLNEPETSSPVIKDDEIELAVSEVVKGVLEIEKNLKKDSSKQLTDNAINKESVDEVAHTDDNQKTDLASAIITNSNLSSNEFVFDDEEEAITISEDIVVKPDVSDAVNLSVDDAVKCDSNSRIVSDVDATVNNVNDVGTAQQVINDVSNETLVAANETSETSTEDFVKSIVNEIVDKCVLSEEEQEHLSNKINNNVVEVSNVSHALSTVTEAIRSNSTKPASVIEDVVISDKLDDESLAIKTDNVALDRKDDTKETELEAKPENAAQLSDDVTSFAPKIVRSQSISTSTSTQVENNHFGKWSFAFETQHSGANFSVFNIFVDQRQRPKSGSTRAMFSPGPARPPFRIPEFKWSYIHQRLLSDVLFSLETDIQVGFR